MDWFLPAFFGIASFVAALLIGVIFINPELVLGLRQWVLSLQWKAMGDVRHQGLRKLEHSRDEVRLRLVKLYSDLHRFDRYPGIDVDRMMSQITSLRVLLERRDSNERRDALLEVMMINRRLSESIDHELSGFDGEDKPYQEIVTGTLALLYPALSQSSDFREYREALEDSPPSYHQIFELYVAAAWCLRAHIK